MGSLTFLEIPDFFDHIIKALDRHPWASLRSLDPGDLKRRKRDLSQPRGTKEKPSLKIALSGSAGAQSTFLLNMFSKV